MVAVVQAGDATDMIPLLDEGTTPGVYNKGRNNKTDFQREFLGGLITKSAGLTFAWKPGIFCASSNNGHSLTDGQLFQVGGGAGAQAVSISPFRAIAVRTGVGPYLISQETTVASLAMPAADGSLPRIDLVCVMPYDKGAVGSDAQHGPKYIVVTGDPNASPTIPALPAAVSDALILGRIARPANDNTIGSGDLTNMQKGVALHGAPRPLLAGDSLSDAGNYHGERRLRLGTQFIDSAYVNAGYTALEDRWDTVNNTWRGTQQLKFLGKTITSTGSMGGNVTSTLATVTIPDPGWPYTIEASASALQGIVGGAATAVNGVYLQIAVDSAVFSPLPAGLILRSFKSLISSPYQMMIPMMGNGVTYTGAHTVSLIGRNESAPSNFIEFVNNEYARFNVVVSPA